MATVLLQFYRSSNSAFLRVCSHVLTAFFLLALTQVLNASLLYTSFAGQGNSSLGVYPLALNASGTAIGSFLSAPHDMKVAGGFLYFLDGLTLYRSNLDFSNLTKFNTFGKAPTSLEVDAVNSSYYLSFDTGGVSSLGLYPLLPSIGGIAIGSPFFSNPHGMEVAGGFLYFLDGNSVYRSNLDGSNLTTFIALGDAPISLEVDAANNHYYLSFAGSGPSSLGVYPLAPHMGGLAIGSIALSGPHDMNVADGYLYFLDGGSVFRANLDGSNRTLFHSFLVSPTSMEIFVDAAVASPEPGTWLMLLTGVSLLVMVNRRSCTNTAEASERSPSPAAQG